MVEVQKKRKKKKQSVVGAVVRAANLILEHNVGLQVCTYSTFHSVDPTGGFSELTANKTKIGRITVEDEGLSNLDLAPALLMISLWNALMNAFSITADFPIETQPGTFERFFFFL